MRTENVSLIPCPMCRGKTQCDCDVCNGRGRIEHPRHARSELARLRGVETAARALCDVCDDEFDGGACADEPDSEPVMRGANSAKPCPITFGHIRRLRSALAAGNAGGGDHATR